MTRTKITLYIGHKQEELTEEELIDWLKDHLQRMLDTRGGITGYTITYGEI